jgi:hypothetical protein
MREPVYIGIDPGASGGLAALSPTFVLNYDPMPETERDIFDWLHALGESAVIHPRFAVIEKVGGFIKGNPAPGSAMFKFGVGYGGLRMALIACGIPFEEVTPQKWQKALGVTPRDNNGNESKSSHKNRLKAKAQQLFPGEKITLAVCDALLIAEYCRRKRQGTLASQPEPVTAKADRGLFE